eukprot:1270294-Prymnesium_polylepis.1
MSKSGDVLKTKTVKVCHTLGKTFKAVKVPDPLENLPPPYMGGGSDGAGRRQIGGPRGARALRVLPAARRGRRVARAR